MGRGEEGEREREKRLGKRQGNGDRYGKKERARDRWGEQDFL